MALSHGRVNKGLLKPENYFYQLIIHIFGNVLEMLTKRYYLRRGMRILFLERKLKISVYFVTMRM
jgi:hypothetical protein